ncbi:MAG: DUF4091 domain-containing protein [Victivallales bacterium]|nr:DUF4091 domain-containing protein [Victivallales bacterium]
MRALLQRCLFSTTALACLVAAGQAPKVLLDFENETDLKLWHYESRDATVPVKEVSRSTRFATAGSSSLCFASPAWKQGMGEWPAFECKPPLTDWSGYDRLAFDATNPTAAEQKLFFFISDSKIATRNGWLERATVPPFGHTQIVVPLSKVAGKKVNLADIHVLHVFTERPPVAMELYIDRLVLLRPGEALPKPSAAYMQQFAPLLARQIETVRQQLADAAARVRQEVAGIPALTDWANTTLTGLEKEVNAYAKRAARADAGLLGDQSLPGLLTARLASLESLVQLRARFARLGSAVTVGTPPRADLAVAFATSMEKVLPRAMSSSLTIATKMLVSLAQNEKESFQVIVLPCERDVKSVRIHVSDLVGAKGTRFAASNVEAVVVGYVETKQAPPYGSSHIGWWPDPILNFQTATDIAKGDAQAFWVRVRAPKKQPPGLYSGKLVVEADGAKAFAFDLTIRVFGFRMPDRTPLPLAVTFMPIFYEPNGQGGWREGPYARADWRPHAWEWADFLADYYLTTDTLYGRADWTPDFASLAKLKQQGRLGRFNLGYYGACGEGDETIKKWRQATIDVIRPRYEKAKELGLLKHAYIYGCDENPKGLFPAVERAAQMLKAEFPGVPVMTTTYDNSFGQESVIKSMDVFCPLTPKFDPARATVARGAGKQVWWYICCGPRHPHANMFIEYPAIEGRLLMGAMTAKYRPDGFLYYQISIWNADPITTGPFTTWDPRSWTTFHGDGSWTCMGPGGTPLPTIRLENFRDGLEDYAYARILEATIAKIEAAPALRATRGDWLQRARKLLVVPTGLVKSLTEYTRDPALVYSYRQRLAEAIEAAGVVPAEL